nr:hypothetical protein [uncultured Acetatifactor sp.]
MDSYSLSYTLDPEQGKILSGLARRCQGINGWGPQELLQYAATANSQAEIDLKLDFLQDEVMHLENAQHNQTEKNRVHISEDERLICRRVADAFAEMYSLDLMVLDAGQYGFVKLQYYQHPFSFDDTCIFTSGRDLFDDLWGEWYSMRLLELTEGTPLADLDYQDMFRCLPENQQKEILGKREYFLNLAGISL